MKGKITKNFLKTQGFRQGTSPGASNTYHFVFKDKLKSGYLFFKNGKTYLSVADMVMGKPGEGFRQINFKDKEVILNTKQDLIDLKFEILGL